MCIRDSVYGSDAVAGVVNYILRRDFTGLEVDVTSQETDLGDSKDRRGSFIWGAESGDTNLVVAYSLSLIHISEPTRQAEISYAVFCLKKKNKKNKNEVH